MTPAPAMTVDEYFRTPESTLPQELIFGRWRAADAPAPRHQSAVFAFAIALNRFVRAGRLGRIYLAPVDVVLDRERHLIVQPDLVFISRPRLGIVRDRIWGAPDLAIEVLSPRPRIGELNEHLGWFAAYGLRECWLHHQGTSQLEVIQFAAGAESARRRFAATEPIRSTVLPAFRASLVSITKDYEL